MNIKLCLNAWFYIWYSDKTKLYPSWAELFYHKPNVLKSQGHLSIKGAFWLVCLLYEVLSIEPTVSQCSIFPHHPCHHWVRGRKHSESPFCPTIGPPPLFLAIKLNTMVMRFICLSCVHSPSISVGSISTNSINHRSQTSEKKKLCLYWTCTGFYLFIVPQIM